MNFWKMNGNGNDFIVVDATAAENIGLDWPAVARALCPRRQSIGADGLLVIERSKTANFFMRIFNADGSEAEMCGNGARCAARFAACAGLAPQSMEFETMAGLMRARVDGRYVEINMGRVRPEPEWSDRTMTLEGETFRATFALVGVPHLVLFSREEVGVDFARRWGERLRNDTAQFRQGTNVTFAAPIARGEMRAVTYERGVEDLTESCGTGCVAVALAARLNGLSGPVTEVHNPGGTNRVSLTEMGNGEYEALLGGTTSLVMTGQTGPDVLPLASR